MRCARCRAAAAVEAHYCTVCGGEFAPVGAALTRAVTHTISVLVGVLLGGGMGLAVGGAIFRGDPGAGMANLALIAPFVLFELFAIVVGGVAGWLFSLRVTDVRHLQS
jgi:hypothetical protein